MTSEEAAAVIFTRTNLDKFVPQVSHELVRIALSSAYLQGRQDLREEQRAQAATGAT